MPQHLEWHISVYDKYTGHQYNKVLGWQKHTVSLTYTSSYCTHKNQVEKILLNMQNETTHVNDDGMMR